MTPAAALGIGALRLFAWGVPLALVYLAALQRRRHRPSALALATVALVIALWSLATDGGAANGGFLAGAGLATMLALGWKLALRRRAGFRDGETLAERLLPILIVADLLLLLMVWPALAQWIAAGGATGL